MAIQTEHWEAKSNVGLDSVIRFSLTKKLTLLTIKLMIIFSNLYLCISLQGTEHEKSDTLFRK